MIEWIWLPLTFLGGVMCGAVIQYAATRKINAVSKEEAEAMAILDRIEKRVEAENNRLQRMLDKYEPKRHNHKPMLDDAPVGRET